MKKIPSAIWVALVLASFYAFFKFAIAPITEGLTGIPAALPSSLLMIYMALVTLAVFFYLSVRQERWESFVHPIHDFFSQPQRYSLPIRRMRRVLLLGAPLLAGYLGYQSASAQLEPPADPPGIHFDLPPRYQALQNPLPWTQQNIREGGVLFVKNCAVCHGDAADGRGMLSAMWQPRPANFRDKGTIAQLDQNYLFWRIKEGAPGLPQASIGYRSAMPAWREVLRDDQIWKIIMFAYTHAGVTPARRK